MNLIDNGIKQVISITPIVRKDEMYFEVDLIDSYNRRRIKKFMDVKDIEKRTWVE